MSMKGTILRDWIFQRNRHIGNYKKAQTAEWKRYNRIAALHYGRLVRKMEAS